MKGWSLAAVLTVSLALSPVAAQTNNLQARLQCLMADGERPIVQVFEQSIVVSNKGVHQHFVISVRSDDYLWGIIYPGKDYSIQLGRFSGELTISHLEQPIEWKYSCPDNLPGCGEYAFPDRQIFGSCSSAKRMF